MMDGLSTRQWVAIGVTVPASIFLLYLLFKRRDEEDNYRPSKDMAIGQQLTIEMKVPYDKVGQIIGQQGVQIKQIQDECLCRAKFQNESGLEETEDRVLVIRGKPDNALCAEKLVRKIINEQLAVRTVEMWIPQWAIGKIIGRNGENIRSLCRASKAKVRIERDSDRSNPNIKRLCTIKGTENQIEYAKGLIEEDIAHEEQYRHKLEKASANRKQRVSRALTSDGKPQEQEPAATKTYNKAMTTSEYETNMQEPPIDGDYFSLYVSAVEHVGHFWVQILSSKAAKLDLLVENMTEHYLVPINQQMHSPDTLCTGDIIAAPFKSDSSWYRARILGFLEDGQVDVYYVDFGDSDKLPRSDVYSLRSDFLSLPHQATECCLAAVEPVTSEWSEKAIDAFEDLTFCAKWRPLMAKIVAYQQTCKGTLPCVELIDTNDTKDVNIAAELVDRGYARFTHEVGSSSAKPKCAPPATDNGSSQRPSETLTAPTETEESCDVEEAECEELIIRSG